MKGPLMRAPLLCCLLLLLSTDLRSAASQDDVIPCRGQLFGTVGFAEAENPPRLRSIPGAIVALRRGRQRVEVTTDEEGDFDGHLLPCGRYEVVYVLAPDRTKLTLLRGQTSSFRMSEGGEIFNLAVQLDSSVGASWMRSGKPSRLDVDCARGNSPLRLTLSIVRGRRRLPIRRREVELVMRNVGSEPLRLNRAALPYVRFFDRHGKELAYIPDYPGGPPPEPATEKDVLTLAPGAEVAESLELESVTEDPFRRSPYYAQAYYHGPPFPLQGDVQFSQVQACSQILVIE